MHESQCKMPLFSSAPSEQSGQIPADCASLSSHVPVPVCAMAAFSFRVGYAYRTVEGRDPVPHDDHPLACGFGSGGLVPSKTAAYYQEHEIRPRRLRDPGRLSLVLWSRFFDWKDSLAIVTTDTFILWHRKGFKFYWRWKSRGGRPALPKEIRRLIARMVKENVTSGEERVAAELSVKLGICVSPRTVRKYWRKQPGDTGRRRTSSQHWRTFVKNHAQGIVACDFLVAVTVRFRVLFVFVAMEVGSRRILHYNVTAHPTADWTLQQFREALPVTILTSSSSMIAIRSSRPNWMRSSRARLG